MRVRVRDFEQNDMRPTRVHFGIWEECLRREKARSFYGVIYLQNESIFWYRREEDCPKRT